MFRNAQEVSAKVRAYIRSGVQCIHLVCGGQVTAAEQMLKSLANDLGLDYKSWDPAKGFGTNQLLNPVQALEAVASGESAVQGNAIVALNDLHYDLSVSPPLVSTLKRLVATQAFNNGRQRRPVFILTTGSTMNPDVVPYMKMIDMALPDREQLSTVFDSIQQSIRDESRRNCDPELRHKIVASLSGLTAPDAADVLAESILTHGKFCDEVMDTVEEEKGLLLRKSSVLTYISKKEIMNSNDLGGFAELKQWLNRRKIAYTENAERLNIAVPKGIVLLGVPGTGKSVCAKVIAKLLQLPLIKMDIGAVFNSLVGESERNTREAIAVAESMNGCVLLIDEADKVLGGAADSTGDSGVTRRIFGQLLTWLAEKKSRTFVVMTMNRIAGIPPEMLRKGRFDEVFFVDTPDSDERRQIFDIHLKAKGMDPSMFDSQEWQEILEASEGFVGAEIQNAISDAQLMAYEMDETTEGKFTAAQLLRELKGVNPVTKVDPVNIEQIRQVGSECGRNVSGNRRRTVRQQVRAMDMSMGDPNAKR